MKTVVISQPMYFPWSGFFELFMHADTFIFLDNVQFSRGFINRVQYKSSQGSKWMTVPLVKHSRDTVISDLKAHEEADWQTEHCRLISKNLKEAPFLEDALNIMSKVYDDSQGNFSEMLISSIEEVLRYFSIGTDTEIVRASTIEIEGVKSAKILNLVKKFDGNRYVSGLGGFNYLNHEEFEENQIEICYMDYKRAEYPQLNGVFDPHVSVLDLIANCGTEGIKYLNSSTMNWRDFEKR